MLNGHGFFGSASAMSKVVVTVVAACIIAGAAFGVKVYAFMNQGDRFTPQMHQESVDDAWSQAREEFMQKDVHERDREYLVRRLDRIEGKLDRLLAAEE